MTIHLLETQLLETAFEELQDGMHTRNSSSRGPRGPLTQGHSHAEYLSCDVRLGGGARLVDFRPSARIASRGTPAKPCNIDAKAKGGAVKWRLYLQVPPVCGRVWLSRDEGRSRSSVGSADI
jgi:hypothetical protein